MPTTGARALKEYISTLGAISEMQLQVFMFIKGEYVTWFNHVLQICILNCYLRG